MLLVNFAKRFLQGNILLANDQTMLHLMVILSSTCAQEHYLMVLFSLQTLKL